jgi:hypothetical protein
MNAKISARILALMTNGATVAEAMDAVLGQGMFEKVAGEIYEALRAEG